MIDFTHRDIIWVSTRVVIVDLQQTTTPSDEQLAAARELIARAAQADGRPPVSDQTVIATAQGKRTLTLVTEGQDLLAIGIVGEGELDLVVDPDHRGRGVGREVLTSQLAQSPGEVRAWSHGENPAADALLQHSGFTPVRSLYKMELDPALLPAPSDPQSVPLPDRFTLRTFDPARSSDSAAWVRVNAAAFADHPEQGRMTVADFESLQAESWFDAEDLLLLEGPDGLSGSTWVKTVREGNRVETELYAIGVDPVLSGQGLGRSLLEATLSRMAQHQPGAVSLYVDGDNDRAVRMYEAAGFEITSRSGQWLKRG